MKVASVYSGRSQSQPILLNELNNIRDIDLHSFRDVSQDTDLLNFDHDSYVLDVDEAEFVGQTALWLSQHRLRERWRDFLIRHLDRDFDLVIGMNDLATPAVDAANVYDVPSLFFIRNLETSGQEMYDAEKGHIQNFSNADFGAKVQYPFFVRNFEEYRRGMTESTKVIANSEYVSRRLMSDFGTDSEVVYPPIAMDRYRVEHDEEGYIAAVNPRNTEKGADIFFDIVENTPSEEFLSAGVFRDRGLEKRANALDNLIHMGYCDDMREFYRQAKLLVVPSRCNEAFGRVAAEAMVNGIPCVVSNRGGLPEVVGETGGIVDEIESVEAWKEAIERALDDHDPEAQKERAERFSAERQGERLHDIIESIL